MAWARGCMVNGAMRRLLALPPCRGRSPGASSTYRLGALYGGCYFASWAAVETPNPKVLKFVPPIPEQRLASATARGRLLGLDGVEDVFCVNGDGTDAAWVAVTRSDDATWDTLEARVQALLEVLEGDDREAQAEVALDSSPAASGIEAEILEVLTHRIRPSVQADGGDVELAHWDAASGEVVLRLHGACRGCPMSAVTLKETITRTLTHFVPQVRSVVAEEPVLDEDAAADPSADLPWEHNGVADKAGIAAMAEAGTPFFSTFAGMRVEGAKLRRVCFMTHVELAGRTPGHIFVNCVDCKARRTIEDPNDLLREDKGNTTGNAAVVICPKCCVVISR